MAGQEHLDSNEMSDQVHLVRLEVEGQEGLQYWIEDCSAQGTIEANTFLYSISISKSTSNSLSKYRVFFFTGTPPKSSKYKKVNLG